jgi:hypothetical protein
MISQSQATLASMALYDKFHEIIGSQLFNKMYRSMYKVARYAKEPKQGHKPKLHLSTQMKSQIKIGNTSLQISLDPYQNPKGTTLSM